MHNHEVETSCLLQEPISWEKVHYKLVIKVKSSVTKLTIAAQFTIKQFVVSFYSVTLGMGFPIYSVTLTIKLFTIISFTSLTPVFHTGSSRVKPVGGRS